MCVRLKVMKIDHNATTSTSYAIDSTVNHNQQYPPDPNVE
jgi:hypothetical protein